MPSGDRLTLEISRFGSNVAKGSSAFSCLRIPSFAIAGSSDGST